MPYIKKEEYNYMLEKRVLLKIEMEFYYINKENNKKLKTIVHERTLGWNLRKDEEQNV